MADEIVKPKTSWIRVIALVIALGLLIVGVYYFFGFPPDMGKLFPCLRECRVLEVRDNCCYKIQCGLNPPETIMLATYLNMTSSGRLCSA